MSKVSTLFSPPSHGFEFANYFEYHFPFKYALPFAGDLELDRVVYGLCGGMCFAALDYFHAQETPPLYAQPQEIDRKLFTYLCERQLDSLKIGVLIKILDWMLAESNELATRILRTELPKLRRLIDKGQPAVLCLIRVQGVQNPTQNHQVIATGYEISADAKSITISLYDPNHPCEEPEIKVGLTKSGFHISQSTGEPLRGFFVLPYAQQKTFPKPAAPSFGSISFSAPGAQQGFRLHWPVDSRIVNQFFNENPENYRGFGLAGHEGVDLYALSGASIYACADGEVIESGKRPGDHPYGVQIRIKHEHDGDVYHTVYAHLKETLVKVGQQVQAGQRIGRADNTGNSFGDHLHLTLKKIGAKTAGYPDDIVDPWPYLQGEVTRPDDPLPSPSGVTVYTNCQLNLRERASADSPLLTTLPAGEALAVRGEAGAVRAKIGQPEQWLQVQTAVGKAGYVAAWLVRDTAAEPFPPSGVIVYPTVQVNLRAGPGTAFALLATLFSTDPLSVLGDAATAEARVGQQNQWLQVQTQSGQRGFVAAWLVHQTGQIPASSGLVVYPTDTVNVRARPSTDANVLTVAAPGDALTVLGDKATVQAQIGQQGQWLNVQTPAKISGYVAAWLVRATSGGSTPVTPGLVVYPTADLNLRAQPSANSPRVNGAFRSDPLTVIDTDLNAARAKIGQQDCWLYVQKKDGSRGWSAAWFLSATPV